MCWIYCLRPWWNHVRTRKLVRCDPSDLPSGRICDCHFRSRWVVKMLVDCVGGYERKRGWRKIAKSWSFAGCNLLPIKFTWNWFSTVSMVKANLRQASWTPAQLQQSSSSPPFTLPPHIALQRPPHLLDSLHISPPPCLPRFRIHTCPMRPLVPSLDHETLDTTAPTFDLIRYRRSFLSHIHTEYMTK